MKMKSHSIRTDANSRRTREMPNISEVAYGIIFCNLSLQMMFLCSLCAQVAHCNTTEDRAQHRTAFSPHDQQQQQTIQTSDILAGFGEENNAAVSLKDKHLQKMDFNMHQKQEDMKEFAGSMMQQRQLTDIHFATSNPQPRIQESNQQSSSQQQNNCLANRDELDKCSAQLIAFGSSKATYPRDMDELNNVYCPRVKKLLACIKDTSTCYSPFDRQVIEWVISSTKKMSNKRCKNENEKTRFVRMVNTCFEPMSSMKDKCMRNYIGSLDAIAETELVAINSIVADEEDKHQDISIQLSCCANRRFKSCMMREAKNHCRSARSLEKMRRTNSISSQTSARKHHKKSMNDMMDDMEATIDGMALSGPEFICRNVSEDFCRTKFDTKFSNKSPKHKSIVPSMIMIYTERRT